MLWDRVGRLSDLTPNYSELNILARHRPTGDGAL